MDLRAKCSHKPILEPFVFSLFLTLICVLVQVCSGQEIIIHNGQFDNEDGDPAKDGDGVKNGVVVFKGGAVHVITSYGVPHGRTLRIEPAAIVKVAGTYTITNGKLTWLPPDLGCGIRVDTFFDQAADLTNGRLEMDGAVLTDIRDDAEGGDTNQDGSASTPPGPSVASPIEIDLSATDQDYIKNSTLKYVGSIQYLGSCAITNNIFLMFQAIISNTYEDVLLGTPLIAGNTFELRTYGANELGLMVQGVSAIIEGNTFRYAPGAERPSSNVFYSPVIVAGPIYVTASRATGKPAGKTAIYPPRGTTIIRNNVFQTGGGIAIRHAPATSTPGGKVLSLYDQITYAALVQNNRFDGQSSVGGSGFIAMTLATAASITVSGNQVIGYRDALDFETLYMENDQPHLQISNNRFEDCPEMHVLNSSATNLDTLWHHGRFIDARNNYWGAPSGPYDPDPSDGSSNPQGKGLTILQGVTYVPFTGGTAVPASDHVSLLVSPRPTEPLAPGTTVSLSLVVNYQLKSAPSGTITVVVRDPDGFILNQPGTTVTVTSNATSVPIPTVQFKVPDLSRTVTVEADLVPDGFDKVTTVSNIEPLRVSQPQNSLQLSSLNPGAGLVPGNQVTLNLSFNYTLATSSAQNPGSIVVDFRERALGTGTDLQLFPSVTIPANPGTSLTATGQVTLTPPLRDVLSEPPSELYLVATLKDDAGKAVGTGSRTVSIDRNANRLSVIALKVFDLNSLEHYSHLLVGTKPVFAWGYDYTIATQGITGWEIWIGLDEVRDATGKLIYSYKPRAPLNVGLATIPQSDIFYGSIRDSTPIPAGARHYRAYLQMRAPEVNKTVAAVYQDFDVRDAANQVTAQIPSGASQVNFSPIPVSLSFTSNLAAGIATAQEFAGQYASTASRSLSAPGNESPRATVAPSLSLVSAAYADTTWQFIPLNRYWALQDTLKDGTFQATVTFSYTPASDFPPAPGFREDSLVVAGLNPLSQSLEPLPSQLNRSTHTISTAYSHFYDSYVVASKATVVTGLAAPAASLPGFYALEQNYPNPFNPSTTIRYATPSRTHAVLTVFNMLGQRVAELVNTDVNAGFHEVQFNARNLASGVYFYRLQAGSFVDVKRLVLIR